ncbi:MAG TPA: sulfatase, partial [Thermoanaerobaculia bacterium]|nr:sulfatase [Thermoanaerobaculia bacterium]
MPAATSRTVGAAHRAPARLPIAAWLLALLAVAGCSRDGERPAAPAGEALRPALLLVTLDTTRADAVAPEAPAADTPALARLAASAVRFTQAYAPAPMTLPAHASLMTGLYPAGHGVHENARALAAGHPLVAERLRQAGYATAAFVSAFPLDRQFGLARGFDLYDDELGAGREERPAAETTARALAWLDGTAGGPTFLWVHYFDPHAPYEPPEPFGSRFPDDPYRGEVAAMDQQLGRLLDAFAARYGDHRILVVGDHGEGLGEHGEAQHGNLLYQGVMRVPLLLAGSGLAPRVVAHPVSTRRVHDTLLAWAGLDGPASLLSAAAAAEPVLGEAMTPFLQYGWQPQVMAVSGRLKAIHAGRLEIYDVVADPGEGRDLAAEARLDRAARQALREYPLPDATPAAPPVDDEARQRLASLGYVAAEGRPPPREGAPRPADMAYLFADLDRGSGHFVREEYAAAIPVFERVAAQDPGNLMVAVRLAVSHSLLGRDEEALRWFRRAEGIDGESL